MGRHMKPRSLLVGPLIIFASCGIVAAMSWQGRFTSIMAFPKVFAAVCLVFGLLSLRKQPKVALAARVILVVFGSGLAFAGGLAQDRYVQQRNTETQSAVMAALGGKPAAMLIGIEPINVTADVLRQASSFSNKATIVNFWSRRCSPCLRELPELNEFYKEHKSAGLAVVAITTFDEDLTSAARSDELAKTTRLVSDLGLIFPVAIAGSNDLHKSYMVYGLPSTALVNANGRIVAYGVGDVGGKHVMEQALALLRE